MSAPVRRNIGRVRVASLVLSFRRATRHDYQCAPPNTSKFVFSAAATAKRGETSNDFAIGTDSRRTKNREHSPPVEF